MTDQRWPIEQGLGGEFLGNDLAYVCEERMRLAIAALKQIADGGCVVWCESGEGGDCLCPCGIARRALRMED